MKPIDPRLLRYARATRGFLAAVVGLGAVGAGLVVAQAMLIAEIVVGSFQDGRSVGDLRTPLLLLVAVAAGRGLVGWLTELAAHRASAAVKSELRGRLLDRATALGPGWLGGRSTGSLVTLATRGVDALDGYFSRYLPQLGLAVVVPAAVLARIVTEEWVSAAIIVGTLPLIPVFMVLIGWATQNRMDRQWLLLSQLSGHFLDVVAGLPTLKVFGRAKAQAASIRKITAEYRRATMRTLRIAFISSFALELLATLSVALVAVTIGMRLVHGELDLYTGLLILILAPEAYLPLRQVGTQYHAAAEGLGAAEEIFAVLETPAPVAGKGTVPQGALAFENVTVRYPGRSTDAVTDVSFAVAPGETVALVGPSGSGKSTLIGAALGFVRPDAGRVSVGGAGLTGLDLADWHRRVAWVPQRPHLYAGTIAENVRLARPDADDAAVRRALRDAGALDFVDALPAAPTPCWARTGRASRPGSGSVSRWPGRSSRTGPCCCSTSRRPPSTGPRRPRSWRRYGGWRRAGRCCSWCTARPCSPPPTGWSGCRRPRCTGRARPGRSPTAGPVRTRCEAPRPTKVSGPGRSPTSAWRRPPGACSTGCVPCRAPGGEGSRSRCSSARSPWRAPSVSWRRPAG
ncbi:hypothetical protein SALBM217S_09335 [Streptomyces griseoloalbus]